MDFVDLEIPFDEAENYFMPANKSKLDRLFYKDKNFDKLLLDTTYYLIGEKGSGKTTYCAYFCNNIISNTRSTRYPISVDDYSKIIQMKKDGKLNYTHYLTLWKAILLTKLLSSIKDCELGAFNCTALTRIRSILKKYNFTKFTMDTFSPVSFMDNESFSHGTISKVNGLNCELGSTTSLEASSQLSSQKYIYEDNWIRFINEIASDLSRLRLKNNHYLFIDGIDTRPSDIPYKEYTECIYPLVRAVYELNNDILCRIKDRRKGRLQIILLTRLDIFLKSGLSNAGSKIADNSVFLNWSMSNEDVYQASDLFALVNNMLSPPKTDARERWNSYFNFKINRGGYSFESFNYFLRLTLSKPRDFVKLLKITKEQCIRSGVANPSKDIIESDLFQRAYSTYFVDSFRTGLGFYYDTDDIRLLIDFIRTMRVCSFTYNGYKKAWNQFAKKKELELVYISCFRCLSLLFDFNIVGLYEDNSYYRWKYREISISNYDYSLQESLIEGNTKFRFHWAVEKEFSLYLR